MRTLLAAAAVVALGMSSGCSGDDGASERRSARERWERLEPTSYSFTYRVGGQAGQVNLSITVADGKVKDSRPIGTPAYEVDPVTIDRIFALLAENQNDADQVDVEYDSDWGFPSGVSDDENTSAIDDEFGFGIGDFRVLEP